MTPVDLAVNQEDPDHVRAHPFIALEMEPLPEATSELPTIEELDWSPYA